MSENKPRILSGMRPTGALHVGHLEGALENYKRLQDSHECYYMVADWHALTTGWTDVSGLKEATLSMVADWLAVGLDPQRCVIFRQSQVLQHAELYTLFSMFTPVPWLERCPSYKEQQQEMPDKDLSNIGFLGYPLLQAADILLYKAQVVPVGVDQMPHVEMTREVARRFNHFFCKPTAGQTGTQGGSVDEEIARHAQWESRKEAWRLAYGKAPIFPEPEGLLARFPKIPGTDGRKMSKSYGNSIELTCPPAELDQKVRAMFTDPLKLRKNDPGHPEGCVVFAFHGVYSPEELQGLEKDCKAGALGCMDCKKRLKERLAARLAPLQEKRASITPDVCMQVLAEGKQKATRTAEATMAEVRDAMNLS
jgi:tryptophanyl-tRNA synthetase